MIEQYYALSMPTPACNLAMFDGSRKRTCFPPPPQHQSSYNLTLPRIPVRIAPDLAEDIFCSGGSRRQFGCSIAYARSYLIRGADKRAS
jgi:hypothetical protein